MLNRLHGMGAGTAVVCVVCFTWSTLAALPVKLSEAVSVADLEAEITAKITEIEMGLESRETFQESAGKRRLATAQVAILSQALAEHDEDAKLKHAAPALRDAALRIGSSTSFDEARSALDALRAAKDGKQQASAQIEHDWAKLARTRVLMDSLRERTDQVRKALRRSKDPVVESRHASMMAMLGLALAAHADDLKNPADRPSWTDWSLELQREMTQTAAALRRQDALAVLEHFKAAQVACDKCHEKFKR